MKKERREKKEERREKREAEPAMGQCRREESIDSQLLRV